MLRKVDKPFLIIVSALMTVGFFMFVSASLGLLAKDNVRLSSVMFNQVFLGLILGSVAMFATSRIHYVHWKKYSFYIFIASLLLTALVFTPLGFEYNGARRWLLLGPISFQPAEFLKLGFVIYFATWLANVKNKMNDWRFSLAPLIGMLILCAGVLVTQPDVGTFLVICLAAISMLFVSGVRWKHLGVLSGLAVVGFSGLILSKPYIIQRIETFFGGSDPLGAGYQIKQSLIAIGSGQFTGRGFGKSIQKFAYLPEPMGDSIFAVTAEEWGFIGCTFLIGLFLVFTMRGFVLASNSRDLFGKLVTIGIIVLIVSQSFLNMASALAIFPVIGMPLLFVSQGGSALAFALLEVGIILNISRYKIK